MFAFTRPALGAFACCGDLSPVAIRPVVVGICRTFPFSPPACTRHVAYLVYHVSCTQTSNHVPGNRFNHSRGRYSTTDLRVHSRGRYSTTYLRVCIQPCVLPGRCPTMLPSSPPNGHTHAVRFTSKCLHILPSPFSPQSMPEVKAGEQGGEGGFPTGCDAALRRGPVAHLV